MRSSISIVAFFFPAFAAMSQVTINEFSASNLSDFPDNYAKHEDWIELYTAQGNLQKKVVVSR